MNVLLSSGSPHQVVSSLEIGYGSGGFWLEANARTPNTLVAEQRVMTLTDMSRAEVQCLINKLNALLQKTPVEKPTITPILTPEDRRRQQVG